MRVDQGQLHLVSRLWISAWHPPKCDSRTSLRLWLITILILTHHLPPYSSPLSPSGDSLHTHSHYFFSPFVAFVCRSRANFIPVQKAARSLIWLFIHSRSDSPIDHDRLIDWHCLAAFYCSHPSSLLTLQIGSFSFLLQNFSMVG